MKTALNGRVSPSLVMDNVRFYEEYIETEIRKGRPETEVLASLGDPRLIARTIVETNKQTGEDAEEAVYRETGYRAGSGNYQQGGYGGYGRDGSQNRMLRVPGWVWLIIVILVVVLIISAVFSVVSVLLPLLPAILLVVFLVKLFRDWLN